MTQSTRIQNKKVKKILGEYYLKIWALSYVSALSGWDLNTYMPKQSNLPKALADAEISGIIHQLITDKNFIKLVKEAEQEDLNLEERRIIHLLNRSIEQSKKLPENFVKEFTKWINIAQTQWAQAKEKSDFSIFAPSLQKIIDMSVQKAEYLGYKDHPYDALIDEFEEGWTTQDLNRYFNSIKEPLIQILHKIQNKKDYIDTHPLEEAKYSKEAAYRLNKKLLKFLGADFSKFRIDTAPHPFTEGLHRLDVRITTWFHTKDIARNLTAVFHEYGHALYELQVNPEFDYTPLSGGATLGLHESQSRFYENFIGRSKSMLKILLLDIRKLGKDFKNITDTDLYKYFNLVRPSLIRVNADEITYHLHIIIRFEIEKMLIEGKLKDIEDLPEIWNQKYKEYLGVTVPNDREGILQDIHWSMGIFGYFPTYSIGTTLSAQIAYHLEKDLKQSINDIISQREEGIARINNWLQQKIHRYGSLYNLKDLLKHSFHEDFNPQYMLNYLEAKYL